MVKVIVPKNNVSDDKVKLVSIIGGNIVTSGQVIAELETSKEIIELTAESSGFIKFHFNVNDQVPVGAILAEISETQISQVQVNQNDTQSKLKLTDKASKFLELGHVDRSRITTLSDILCGISLKDCVIVIGAGRQAAAIIDVIRSDMKYHILGCVDPHQTGRINDIAILGDDNILPILFDMGVKNAVMGFGGANAKMGIRQKIFDKVRSIGFKFPVIRHQSSVVEKSAILGDGSIICPLAYVGTNCKIGENCLINVHVSICHDSSIGNHTHIAPQATIAGSCKIGDSCLIGMNTSVSYGSTIGDRVVICNNKAVSKDIASDVVVRD